MSFRIFHPGSNPPKEFTRTSVLHGGLKGIMMKQLSTRTRLVAISSLVPPSIIFIYQMTSLLILMIF
jgi:hypothetical protein